MRIESACRQRPSRCSRARRIGIGGDVGTSGQGVGFLSCRAQGAALLPPGNTGDLGRHGAQPIELQSHQTPGLGRANRRSTCCAPLFIVVMIVARSRRLMGDYVNGKVANILGWVTVVLRAGASIAVVAFGGLFF